MDSFSSLSQKKIFHPLLTAEVTELLAKNGVETVQQFLQAESEDLKILTKHNKNTIERIKSDLRRSPEIPTYQTTNIESLDNFLGGGLRMSHVYEIAGRSGVGKSLLCLTIALQLARDGEGVLYIDTNGGFDPIVSRRILVTSGSSEEDVDNILGRIRVQSIKNTEMLKDVLSFIWCKRSRYEDCSLLIVDTMANFHSLALDLTNKGWNKIKELNRYCYSLMHRIARNCDMTVILVNVLLTKDDSAKIAPDSYNIGLKIEMTFPEKPFTRLRIDQLEADSPRRLISVLSSDHLSKEATTTLNIKSSGFV